MGLSKGFLQGLMDNQNFKKWFGESVVRDAEGLPLEVYHGTKGNFESFDPSRIGATDEGWLGKGFYFTPHEDVAQVYGSNVIPAHLKMENPFRFPEDANPVKYVREMGGPEVFTDMLRREGYDGVISDRVLHQQMVLEPTQIKHSRANAGTFDPTDPNFLKSAGLMTAGAGAAAYGMSPDDAEAAKLPRVLDFGDIRLPLDAKGMATLYHATSPEAADKIVASKMLKSAGEPSVYFSTSKEGTGYGPAVVEAKVPGSMLQIDDVFPDGRADFRVDKSNLPMTYVKRILGLGLTGAGAYGLMGGDDNAEAMYIGPKGLANLFGPDAAKSMLTDAEKMAAKGVGNEEIRQATGLFQGMDGKWRYEVDDSASQALRPQYPPNFMNQAAKEAGFSSYIDIPMAERKPVNARADQLKSEYADPFSTFSAMSNHFKHDDLYKAYPELADAPTRVDSTARRNGVTYSDGSIEYGGGSIGGDGDRPTLLHELQHAIQQQEGFAVGGTPSVMAWASPSQRPDLIKVAQQTMDEWKPATYEQFWGKDVTPEGQAAYADYLKDFSSKEQEAARWNAAQQGAPGKIYENLAGEIEARDTAARMNLTPEQRRATPPDLRDNAIVRFDGGQAASVPQRREWAKDVGNNTPNIAQAVAPNDPFSPSPSHLASAAALAAAIKAKDAPLEDTYQPADLLTAFLTGGGGLMSRGIQAALDPAMSAAFDYVPRFADAINPRNIVMGLMR